MLHISQVPITVTLSPAVKEVHASTGRDKVPFDLLDIPTEFPVQVIGWTEWRDESGRGPIIPCWLLLGWNAVYPVAMTLVKPTNWE